VPFMVSWLTYRDWRAAMYPTPRDVAAFERLYQDEHVPMAVK